MTEYLPTKYNCIIKTCKEKNDTNKKEDKSQAVIEINPEAYQQTNTLRNKIIKQIKQFNSLSLKLILDDINVTFMLSIALNLEIPFSKITLLFSTEQQLEAVNHLNFKRLLSKITRQHLNFVLLFHTSLGLPAKLSLLIRKYLMSQANPKESKRTRFHVFTMLNQRSKVDLVLYESKKRKLMPTLYTTSLELMDEFSDVITYFNFVDQRCFTSTTHLKVFHSLVGEAKAISLEAISIRLNNIDPFVLLSLSSIETIQVKFHALKLPRDKLVVGLLKRFKQRMTIEEIEDLNVSLVSAKALFTDHINYSERKMKISFYMNLLSQYLLISQVGLLQMLVNELPECFTKYPFRLYALSVRETEV